MESERYERVMTSIKRKVPDRVPWTLWGHFPSLPFLKYYSWEKANRDGEESAKAHIALLNELDYKMDLLKVTPFYKFMAYHWGSKFKFLNNEETTETVEVVVKETKDWKKYGCLTLEPNYVKTLGQFQFFRVKLVVGCLSFIQFPALLFKLYIMFQRLN